MQERRTPDEQHDVVVIGAGQAGLAIGYYLARAGADFVILDAGARVGGAWRGYWDSLRLFTPRRYNHLPGMPFHGDPEAFPHKDEVADYLEAYAAQLALPVRLGVRVTRVRRARDRFEIETPDHVLRARTVVVATGSHASAIVPGFAGELDPAIVQMTANQYRNPTQLPPGDVLVVGAGNSGVQIAMELAATRPTWLAGPSTGRIPLRILGHDVLWWIDALGIMRLDVGSAIGRRIVTRMRANGDPVIGVTARDLRTAGVRRRARVVGVDGGLPKLGDGSIVPVQTVVWCCGLRPDFSFIEGLATDESGVPRHTRGRAEALDGLYFMGLRAQNRVGSATIAGAGLDAMEISAEIVARATSHALAA